MSGKIKFGGLVFAAALVLLFPGQSFGQDPCGGTYAGEGLKALFWPNYDDLDPQNPGSTINFPSNILNDTEGWAYQYQVPGGDCVFLFRRGHVVVAVDRPEETDGTDEDRFVQMNLVLHPKSAYCANTPATLRMAHIHTVSFYFVTEKEFIPIRENGKLILTCQKYGWNYLSFGALTPGTYYTQISIRFKVFGDPDEYRFDIQAKVYYGILNETGTLGWRVTPIHEPYVVRVIEKRGKRIIDIQNTSHNPSVYLDIGFPGADCKAQTDPEDPETQPQGLYHFPFAMILQRLY